MRQQKNKAKTRTTKPLGKSELSREPRRNLTELFLSNTSEIVKLYTSVHRVNNYFPFDDKYGTERPKLGEKRLVRKFSEPDWLNPFTPKISHEAFRWLKENEKQWSAYQEQVLRGDIVEESPNLFLPSKPDYRGNGKIEPTYLRLIHNLESSWLFQRAYYKIFNDYHTQTKTFLELEAFTLTHSNQFFMREFLNYLEGNYVVSVRGTGKVYVPHLQAELDSVDLAYTSAYGIGHEDVIADYFEKSMVGDTKQLLKNFEEMSNFEADVIGGFKDKIFLKYSQYVNQDSYLKMLREWLTIIGDHLLPYEFNNREGFRNKIDSLIHEKLRLASDLFNIDSPDIKDLITNYNDDRHIFCEVREASAIKRLLRMVFVSMIEYSINRHRMESRGGPGSEAERTEYETVFRRYREMTLLEQRLNSLVVEDGEISLVLMLSRYLSEPQILQEIEALKIWGLVEESGKNKLRLKFSSRAQRMAKWYAKIAGWKLQYKNAGKQLALNYSDNKELRAHYDPLSLDEEALFHWTRLVRNENHLKQILSEIALSGRDDLEQIEVTQKFQALCNLCLEGKEARHRETVDICVRQRARFNQKLNEFLRTNETISRSVVSIPISTIPTEIPGLKEKIYGFSIFIGTFRFSDGLDDDKNFAFEARELEETLRAAKVYFTLIGKPASEVLNQFVVEEVSAKRVANTLGKAAHALKNVGVSFRAQIDTLKETIRKEVPNQLIQTRVAELEKEFEQLSGAINLLNLASNPFQAKYLDERPYCLLDVIFQAYCNAFDQFLIAGPKLELSRLRAGKGDFFKAPTLRVSIENRVEPNIYKIDERLVRYYPDLPQVSFEQPSTPKLDAETVLSKEQIFEDLLPDRHMLLSAYFEIFNNALFYALKETEEIYIEVNLRRRENEIVIEVANETSGDNLQRLISPIRGEEEQYRARGAGVDTNILFFKSIGGDFRLIPETSRLRAVAVSRIDLQFLRELQKGIEP